MYQRQTRIDFFRPPYFTGIETNTQKGHSPFDMIPQS